MWLSFLFLCALLLCCDIAVLSTSSLWTACWSLLTVSVKTLKLLHKNYDAVCIHLSLSSDLFFTLPSVLFSICSLSPTFFSLASPFPSFVLSLLLCLFLPLSPSVGLYLLPPSQTITLFQMCTFSLDLFDGFLPPIICPFSLSDDLS